MARTTAMPYYRYTGASKLNFIGIGNVLPNDVIFLTDEHPALQKISPDLAHLPLYGLSQSERAKARSNLGMTKDVALFDAKGDGVTDDTAAVAAAVASMQDGDTLVFPPGTYMLDYLVIPNGDRKTLDCRAATILKRVQGGSVAGNSLMRTIPVLANGSYYGPVTNFSVVGGRWGANGFDCSNNLLSFSFIDGLVLDGLTIIQYPTASHAISITAKNATISRIRIPATAGAAVFNDGIHFYQGENCTMSDCIIYAGDDAIAIGNWGGTTYDAGAEQYIKNVTVTNCILHSARAHAIAVFCETNRTTSGFLVSDITISNITGTGGTLRNGGIYVGHKAGGAVGTSLVKRVSITNVNLDVGSASHDDTNGRGIEIQTVSGLTLENVHMSLTQGASATTGFDFVYVRNSENVTLRNLNCPGLQKRYGFDIRSSTGVTILGGEMRSTAVQTLQPVNLVDVTGFLIDGLRVFDVQSSIAAFQISSGTTSAGIVRGCKAVKAVGATSTSGIYGGTTGNGFFTYLQLDGNDFSGMDTPISTSIQNTNGSYTIANNRGFITQTQGTATVTAGATSVTLSHNLRFTPSVGQITISSTSTLGTATKAWVSATTSTNFTITLDAAPGGSGATFAWTGDVSRK